MEGVHVHAPPARLQRRILRCPSNACRRRRRHTFLTYEWYDPIVTCCHCGFTRGMANWLRRKDPKRAEQAKRQWAT